MKLNKSLLRIYFFLLLITSLPVCSAQVKIRLFSDRKPGHVFFAVTTGKYEANLFPGEKIELEKGQIVMISKYNGRLAFKTLNQTGYVIDSLYLTSQSGDDSFSLTSDDGAPVKQFYTGDLKCLPDLGTIMLINEVDEEKYIAGVVKAEGGTGKNIEYFKSQAVLVRTYLNKYHNKHLQDGYNLCDNTHCQVYSGTCDDAVINSAALETKGMVILDRDSILIISAFHSNCGGETSSAEYVWLTKVPYLKRVIDPYCSGSRNSTWQKSIPVSDWIKIIRNEGFKGTIADPAALRFLQGTRMADYKIPAFSVPFRTLRTDLDLRSAFFSVIPQDDLIILKGKGYGHGVGLCQEGAMEMASKGFDYRQIIDFYFSGVIISDIRNSVTPPSVTGQ
jgi:stage II sporulation protein D